MSSEGRDETFLLARARGGDLSAFEEVVRRYQRRVYGVALRIVRSHAVADDVTQDAFVRAWRSLDRFEVDRPFGPWVCRIAANLAVNHVRSPAAREDPLPEEPGTAAGSGSDPLGSLLDAEAHEVLERALGSLPAEQRAVFVLRTVEEMSYREIAEALGLSPGTVMSRLFRARERLARSLAPYLGEAARRRSGGSA
jgi:RNA polymerase sigma-70 factor (ECF subfamily)